MNIPNADNRHELHALLATALCFYYPFNVTVYSTYWKMEGKISCLALDDKTQLDFGDGFPRYDKNECIKLILHPLENFKDINSEMFTEFNFDMSTQIDINDVAVSYKGVGDIDYSTLKKCLKNHIDIFDLIPKGLAVPL